MTKKEEREKTRNQTIKQAINDGLEGRISIIGIEKVPNPFDRSKRKWRRIMLEGGFSLIAGYDYGEYHVFFEKWPDTFPLESFLRAEGVEDDEKMYSSENPEKITVFFRQFLEIYNLPERAKDMLKIKGGFKLAGGVHKAVPKQTGHWFSISTIQGFNILMHYSQGVFSMRYKAPSRFPIQRYANGKVEGDWAFTTESAEDLYEVLETIAKDFLLWRTNCWEHSFGRSNSIRTVLFRRLPLWVVVLLTMFLTAVSTAGMLFYRAGDDMLFSMSLLPLVIGGMMVVKTLRPLERRRYSQYPFVKPDKHVLFTPLATLLVFYAAVVWCLFILGTMLF